MRLIVLDAMRQNKRSLSSECLYSELKRESREGDIAVNCERLPVNVDGAETTPGREVDIAVNGERIPDDVDSAENISWWWTTVSWLLND